jgi:hypothetical protein
METFGPTLAIGEDTGAIGRMKLSLHRQRLLRPSPREITGARGLARRALFERSDTLTYVIVATCRGTYRASPLQGTWRSPNGAFTSGMQHTFRLSSSLFQPPTQVLDVAVVELGLLPALVLLGNR